MLGVGLTNLFVLMTAKLREEHVHARQGSGLRQAGLQSRDQRGGLETSRPRASDHIRIGHCERQPDVHGFAYLGAEELRWRDADDAEYLLIANDGLSENAGLRAKPPLPISVTDHRHGMTAE